MDNLSNFKSQSKYLNYGLSSYENTKSINLNPQMIELLLAEGNTVLNNRLEKCDS